MYEFIDNKVIKKGEKEARGVKPRDNFSRCGKERMRRETYQCRTLEPMKEEIREFIMTSLSWIALGIRVADDKNDKNDAIKPPPIAYEVMTSKTSSNP